MDKVIHDLAELTDEASSFVTSLIPRTRGATLVTLSGELGAGKTAFTKAIAIACGVKETVTSPTFVLEKIYTLPPSAQFKRLVHIDAYRLEEGDSLHTLDFVTLMQDPSNLIVLEWPEKVGDALPFPAVRILLVAHEDGSRTITYAH
jgi:tRNA threonylcarbamoyladenosine biosynthesis protein TsaE